jgi:hypothetical protein
MLGHKKDKNTHFLGSKYNQSHLGMGHKKHPIQSSHSNVKGISDISNHKTMDEHQPTGLNLKKNKTKTSGLERN